VMSFALAMRSSLASAHDGRARFSLYEDTKLYL
jgi:hypothetical protein